MGPESEFLVPLQEGEDGVLGVIKTIVEKLKLKELFAIIFIAAIVITAMPNDMAQRMKIDTFRNTYQTYISLCIIAIGAYYVARLLGWIKKYIWGKFHNWKRIGTNYMKEYMSPDEMELLMITFYDANNHIFRSSGTIDCLDGRKAALESKHIIYLASRTGTIIKGFSYNLQPYALEFLNKNLEEGNIRVENNELVYELK